MSQVFEWDGVLQPGDRLIIDTERQQVRRSGANMREGMSGVWPMIQPGGQGFALEADDLEEAVVTVTWRDRWQ